VKFHCFHCKYTISFYFLFDVRTVDSGEGEYNLLRHSKEPVELIILDNLQIFHEKCIPELGTLLAALLKLLDRYQQSNITVLGIVNGTNIKLHESIRHHYRFTATESVEPMTSTQYDQCLKDCITLVNSTENSSYQITTKEVMKSRENAYSTDMAIDTIRNLMWSKQAHTVSSSSTTSHATTTRNTHSNHSTLLHTSLPSTIPSKPVDYGYEEVKTQLLTWFQPVKYDLLAAFTIPPPRGIVFAGPSGSGKSFLTSWLVKQMRQEYFILDIPCADLVHKQVGQSEQVITNFFTQGEIYTFNIVSSNFLYLLCFVSLLYSGSKCSNHHDLRQSGYLIQSRR